MPFSATGKPIRLRRANCCSCVRTDCLFGDRQTDLQEPGAILHIERTGARRKRGQIEPDRVSRRSVHGTRGTGSQLNKMAYDTNRIVHTLGERQACRTQFLPPGLPIRTGPDHRQHGSAGRAGLVGNGLCDASSPASTVTRFTTTLGAGSSARI